jgi:hydroxyacylglutathione hydrolase
VAIDPSYPIGRFDPNTRWTAASRREAIEDIAGVPTNLRRVVSGLEDEQLDTPYRPGGWTVRQVVHHVTDAHIHGYIRLKLALTETNPTFVIDTHVHADHLSTGPELAAAVGAPYVLHENAGAHYVFMPVRDGQRLSLGNVEFEVLHTPGHTPEHLSLLVIDRTRSPEPWALLTGHTLMVGDLGRTELASDATSGAKALFATASRLRQLPDHVEVWPGAFAGSVCGRALSGKPSSTIGFERRFNRVFAIEDERTFVQSMLERIPPPPPDAERTRRRNLGLADVLA